MVVVFLQRPYHRISSRGRSFICGLNIAILVARLHFQCYYNQILIYILESTKKVAEIQITSTLLQDTKLTSRDLGLLGLSFWPWLNN